MSKIPMYRCDLAGCTKELENCFSYELDTTAGAHLEVKVSVFPDKFDRHACCKNHMNELIAKAIEGLTYQVKNYQNGEEK